MTISLAVFYVLRATAIHIGYNAGMNRRVVGVI
jgi:hypothetical protein